MDKKRRTVDAADAAESIEAAGVNITTPVDAEAIKKAVTDFQEGMQMVLRGYSRVFSALAGMEPGVTNTSTVPGDSTEDSISIDAASTPDAEKQEKTPEKAPEKTPEKTPEKASAAPEETKPSKKTKKPATESKEENAQNQDASSTISYDDLKRVVIAKIEQKQENNQKIGELVKKYDVKNIGELDAKQREAFMSELAAI